MHPQHISLQLSVDNGRTWKKYEGNPVLDLNKRDFRDPKVFWHTPTKKWVMVVMLPNEHLAKFYGSPDLKTWSHLSDFGPAGDMRGVWECPDLLQVPIVDQSGKSKWVLLTSQHSSMQYFVGEFDGSQFRNENPADTILRPDYGPDFYAGITYNNLPTGHDPVLIAWASNPGYAQATPTSPWRSAMSVPRSMRLKKTGNTWTLLQQPMKQLQTLRGPVTELKNKLVTNEPVCRNWCFVWVKARHPAQYFITKGQVRSAGSYCHCLNDRCTIVLWLHRNQ